MGQTRNWKLKVSVKHLGSCRLRELLEPLRRGSKPNRMWGPVFWNEYMKSALFHSFQTSTTLYKSFANSPSFLLGSVFHGGWDGWEELSVLSKASSAFSGSLPAYHPTDLLCPGICSLSPKCACTHMLHPVASSHTTDTTSALLPIPSR